MYTIVTLILLYFKMHLTARSNVQYFVYVYNGVYCVQFAYEIKRCTSIKLIVIIKQNLIILIEGNQSTNH